MRVAPIAELFIELTTQCPLQCKHCSTFSSSQEKHHLPLAEVIRLIREGVALGARRLSLSGGEPLSYPDLPLLLTAVREVGLSCTVYTCGVTSTDNGYASLASDTLRWLREHGVNRVVFSLHGATPHVHDSITQVSGSMELALRSIDRAVAAGLAVEIHTVPMRPNLAHLVDIVRIGRALGVTRVSFLRPVAQGRFLEYREELAVGVEEWEWLRTSLLTALEARGASSVRCGAPFNCMLIRPPIPCTAGVDKVLITPYGRVLPCEAFKHCQEGAGSISGRSISEVWLTDSLLNQVRFYRRNPGPCQGCTLYEGCRGGCLGQRALNGAMDTVDPLCPSRFLYTEGRVEGRQ